MTAAQPLIVVASVAVAQMETEFAAATPVTFPFESTVAFVASDVDHVTVLLRAGFPSVVSTLAESCT